MSGGGHRLGGRNLGAKGITPGELAAQVGSFHRFLVVLCDESCTRLLKGGQMTRKPVVQELWPNGKLKKPRKRALRIM